MIKNIDIEIIVNKRNIESYEKLLKKELRPGEVLVINQNILPKEISALVECECDICKKSFMRYRRSISSKKTLCSKECKRENHILNNPNPKKEKNEVNCELCKKKIMVNDYTLKNQKHFFCSHEHYSEFRSKYYNGEKIYNYNKKNKKCDMCKKSIVVDNFTIDRNKHIFCGNDCYYEHRKKYYSEFYYSPRKRENEKDTTPELIVREWLEKNNIRYKKDAGFLKKYYCDFYLKDFKIVLEVYGDYWHVNPDVYNILGDDSSKKSINNHQENFIIRDKIREEEFISKGFDYRVIWEKEIHEDVDKYMNLVLKDKIESPETIRSAPKG